MFIFATVIFEVNGNEDHKTKCFDVVQIVTFLGEKSPNSVNPTNNTKFVLYSISIILIGPHFNSYNNWKGSVENILNPVYVATAIQL